jgi:hypothetical protein
MAPSPSGMRVSRHLAHARARTYATLEGGRVAATVTMFHDSPLGLPADAVFGDVLADLRAEGRHVVEAGMLGFADRAVQGGSAALLQMMKLVFWAAQREGGDDLLATVHPRHARFYSRTLGFTPVGGRRDHRSVQGAPAALVRMDLRTFGPHCVRRPQIRRFFFPPPPLQPAEGAYRIPPEDLAFFFADHLQILADLDAATFGPGRLAVACGA